MSNILCVLRIKPSWLFCLGLLSFLFSLFFCLFLPCPSSLLCLFRSSLINHAFVFSPFFFLLTEWSSSCLLPVLLLVLLLVHLSQYCVARLWLLQQAGIMCTFMRAEPLAKLQERREKGWAHLPLKLGLNADVKRPLPHPCGSNQITPWTSPRIWRDASAGLSNFASNLFKSMQSVIPPPPPSF